MIVRTSSREAVTDLRALHDAGHAAKLVSNGAYAVALDLDAPIVDVVDVLFEIGHDAETAEDLALDYVKAGS